MSHKNLEAGKAEGRRPEFFSQMIWDGYMPLTKNLKSRVYLEAKETELLLQSYKKGDEISLSEPGFWQVTDTVGESNLS